MGERTKHGPRVHGPPFGPGPWATYMTRSMDPLFSYQEKKDKIKIKAVFSDTYAALTRTIKSCPPRCIFSLTAWKHKVPFRGYWLVIFLETENQVFREFASKGH